MSPEESAEDCEASLSAESLPALERIAAVGPAEFDRMHPEENFTSFSLQLSATAFSIKSTVKDWQGTIPQLRKKPGYYPFVNVSTISPSKFDSDDHQNFGFEIEPQKYDAAIGRNVPHAPIPTAIAAQRHLPGPLPPADLSTHEAGIKGSIVEIEHTIAARTPRLSKAGHTYLERSKEYQQALRALVNVTVSHIQEYMIISSTHSVGKAIQIVDWESMITPAVVQAAKTMNKRNAAKAYYAHLGRVDDMYKRKLALLQISLGEIYRDE